MSRCVAIRNFSLAVLILNVSAWAQVNVLTQHNDNARTGANLNETILNTSNVRPGRFGKLFSRAVDGQIYTQPLYVSNLTMPDGSTHNVVYLATQHDSVYAFDADDPDQSAPLWKVNLGSANVTPNADFGCTPAQCPFGPYHDLFPEVGITGTPVIDLSTQTLYVVAFTKELGAFHQRLHALDITTGAEKFGAPVEISGSVPGTGDGSVNGQITFDPKQHLQRPALLLSNGVIYVAFASHADYNPYHGWVFAYDPATLSQLGIYCSTPNGGAGGIWQANQGPAADAAGSVYLMTGNNRVAHPDPDLPNLGESFIRLTLGKDTGLAVADYFSPCNQCCLDKNDTDLGSAGPLLIPDTDPPLVVGLGKQGRAYLLNRDNLGQNQCGQTPNCPNITTECNTCADDQIVQRFQATTGSSFSSPIYWNGPDGPIVYFWGNSDKLRAYKMVNGIFRTTPDSVGLVTSQFGGSALSLSANGNQPGTGIVWSSVSLGNANPITQLGEFHAFDASNVRIDLWGTDINDAFDGLGILAKFNPPTIANGKVYIASASGQLHVYGLLPLNPPPLVRLTAPTTRSVVVGPADVALTATALTRDGSPGSSVDFYVDGEFIGTATDGPPYNFVWQQAPLGPHTLNAVATAPNGAQAKSNSIDVNVVASAPPIGSIISIKFPGSGTSMGRDELAGVDFLARSNWNNAVSEDPNLSKKEGWIQLHTLVDDSGMDTGAKMSWTSNLAFALTIADDPGNFRMMRGYLDTSNTTSTNVTVYDLPASFTANGYDVYVYFDGDNGSESRLAQFRVGSTVVTGTDAAGLNFSGDFIQAIAGSAGNYVVIPGLTEDRFTLEAIPNTTPIGTRRAPVNSIQIVAHGGMQ